MHYAMMDRYFRKLKPKVFWCLCYIYTLSNDYGSEALTNTSEI